MRIRDLLVRTAARKHKEIVACLMAFLFLLVPLEPALRVWADTLTLDGTESAWAKPELEKAYAYGLTYPTVMGSFQKPITREEFCVIVVKLYEKLTGLLVLAGTSPFSDTTDPEIVKAFRLGIVMGTGAGKFSPELSITRQEIAAMIYRALDKAVPPLRAVNQADFPFADKAKVATWALASMTFAYQNNIMKGVSATTIDPLSNTTREQGIALIKRTFDAFCPGASAKATLVLPTGNAPLVTQKAKYLGMDWDGLLNAPAYDKRLTLYVATGADKPASKPTDKLQVLSPSFYSKADCAALIERSGNRVRSFAYTTTGTAPTKVVWQVTTVPFTGYATNWQNPPGLVASGEVVGTAEEFTIDFGAVAAKLDTTGRLQPLVLPLPRKLTTVKTQQTLYVRAVPVDGRGACLGDPGEGMRVLYGDALTTAPSASTPATTASTFQIWTPRGDGKPGGSVEFPNTILHLAETSTSCEGAPEHWFQFRGADASATSVVVQVAAQPFSTTESWDAPSGLVYSQTYASLPIALLSSYPNTISITFSKFAPAASTLKPGDSIPYYLRFVGLRTGTVPGTTSVLLSESIKVNYYKQQTVIVYQQKTKVIPAYCPSIQVLHYEPVQWEDPNWAHYYTVYRYPRWNELTFNITNGTSILHPYYYYLMTDPTMTPERYEKEILWKWLVPGSKLQIWDRQEDKSFWQELWDGIVNFFASMAQVVAKVVNWTSSSFAKLKLGIVAFIAANFPGIPDSWRGYLQTALTMLADSGLAALGIPPTLPNFDDLANGGLDYLAKEALASAGVPESAITDALVNEAKTAIGKKLADATDSASPNPLNAPFLHADASKLYRPAYIDVKVTNPSTTHASQSGSLNIDVGWEWKETGIAVETTTWADQSEGQQWAAGLAYASHFFWGLRKGHPYYPCYYCIYEPIRDVPLPSLQPGTSTTIRVYLKEYTGKPYPFAPQGEDVTWDDFTNLYWGNTGKATFSVWTSGFNLPPITPATSLDTTTNTITTYFYDSGPSTVTFQSVPKDACTP